MWQVEVSHKSKMAGPFNRGDTIINKHFTLLYFVGFLTFHSRINTASKRLKARKFFICQYFSVYEQLKFRAQLS